MRLSTEVLAAKPEEKGGKKHLVLLAKKKKTKMSFSFSPHEKIIEDDLLLRDALKVKSKRLTKVYAHIDSNLR